MSYITKTDSVGHIYMLHIHVYIVKVTNNIKITTWKRVEADMEEVGRVGRRKRTGWSDITIL